MSLDATRWAWMQQGLSAQQKLVLLALADRADERDICFPSVARLSGDTGLDRKTIMRAVASLEQAGIMEVVRSSGAGNRYRLVGVEHREDRGKAPTKTSAECGTGTAFGTGAKTGTTPVPKTGLVPVPKTGHEPITEPINNLSPPAPRARATPPDPTADTQSPQPAWLAREQQRHSASIAAARRELAAGGGAFPLTAEWRPGPDFAGRAQLAGAPGEYTAAQLGEFVSYWSAEGAVARQGQWEHRFLKRLQRDALAAHTPGDYRHATRRPGADTTAIDLHDTSWLDDDALEYARSGAEIGAQARRRAAGKPGV